MPTKVASRAAFAPATVAAVFWLSLAVLLTGCVGMIGKPDSGPTAIVVSDSTPAYEQVAESLRARLYPTPRIFRLENSHHKAEAMRLALAGSDETLIAIGAFALQSARRLGDRRVIFCQVFHYEDSNIGPPARGVKATPPLARQFQAWKSLNPNLARVAIVTGSGLGDLPAEARRAAREIGIDVTHIEVRTDKEMLYAVRGMAVPPQGMWIAPDHRVLNAATLRELLAYAVRRGIEVVVFNRQLLSYGALMSAESDPNDVADRVYELVNTAGEGGPRVVSLRRARIQVNTIVAGQFGLTVPPALGGDTHGY